MPDLNIFKTVGLAFNSQAHSLPVRSIRELKLCTLLTPHIFSPVQVQKVVLYIPLGGALDKLYSSMVKYTRGLPSMVYLVSFESSAHLEFTCNIYISVCFNPGVGCGY